MTRLVTRDALLLALLRWARAAGLVAAFWATGRLLDAVIGGGPTTPWLVVGGVGAVVAGVLDATAERLVANLAATTATRLRGQALRAVLAADRLPVLAGHPGGGRSHGGRPAGSPAGGHPGGGLFPGGRPAGSTSGGHQGGGRFPGGRPAGSPGAGPLSGAHPGSRRQRGPEGAGAPGRPSDRATDRPSDRATAEGAVVEALTASVDKVAAYRAGFLGPTLGAFTVPVLVVAAIALTISPRVALLQVPFMLAVPPLVGTAMRLTRSTAGRYRRATASLTSLFLETIAGLGTLQLLGAWRRRGARIAQTSERARFEVMRLLRSSQLVILATDAIFGILLVTATAGLGLSELRAGRITAGQAISLLLLTTVLVEPVQRLGRSFYVGMAGAALDRQVRDLLASATTQTRGDASASGTGAPSAILPGGAQPITLSDVSVTLGRRTVLDRITLDIPAGAWVAVVGPSGSGKSTLLDAIQGLVATAGTVRVGDGRHERMGLVTTVRQASFLFSGTVADNLRLARPDADDDALWLALDTAQLAADVASWPRGLDTPVGEGGLGLSGGQARRLALARADLAATGVLLLDEVTADLDLETQARVTRAVAGLAGSRTVVSVAHRLETTALADRVIVLVDGRIVDEGSRDELAARPGWFADAMAVETPS